MAITLRIFIKRYRSLEEAQADKAGLGLIRWRVEGDRIIAFDPELGFDVEAGVIDPHLAMMPDPRQAAEASIFADLPWATRRRLDMPEDSGVAAQEGLIPLAPGAALVGASWRRWLILALIAAGVLAIWAARKSPAGRAVRRARS